jgi:hypothetical protein
MTDDAIAPMAVRGELPRIKAEAALPARQDVVHVQVEGIVNLSM